MNAGTPIVADRPRYVARLSNGKEKFFVTGDGTLSPERCDGHMFVFHADARNCAERAAQIVAIELGTNWEGDWEDCEKVRATAPVTN